MTNKRKYVIISLKLKKERINKKMKIINYTVELTKYNNKGISTTQLNILSKEQYDAINFIFTCKQRRFTRFICKLIVLYEKIIDRRN